MGPVVVWPGHVGKPEPDPGACGPSVCEADITGQLAAALCAALREAGLVVADLGAGTYVDREEAARWWRSLITPQGVLYLLVVLVTVLGALLGVGHMLPPPKVP